MTDPVRYLLDANVFIQAKRSYYAFDLCPGYWKALLAHHGSGRLCSIDRVRDELLNGADELADWVKSSVPDGFFVSSAEPAVATWFGKMMSWAQSQAQFLPVAKAEFAGKADGWLIAYAKTHGLKLVTLEKANPAIKKKVPMPNVCDAFGVQYLDTFDMLRVLKTKLEWHGKA
ncbi:MAG: DUF4411 family protein [Betaproteobacteria bacterium]|nr:DUF4411 family protein [Betaproteobacteria bacterium]